MKEPIFEKEGEWWFYDNLWADIYGPYNSKKEAEKFLEKFCKEFLEDRIEIEDT